MPRKKRLTYDDKRRSVIAKLIFISVVVALVLLANFLMRWKGPVKPAKTQTSSIQTEPDVLGERIVNDGELKDTFQKTVDSLQKQAFTAKDELEGASEDVISNSKDKASETISNAIYESTLKPILEKIHDLPAQQQEVIREAVCR